MIHKNPGYNKTKEPQNDHVTGCVVTVGTEGPDKAINLD